MKQVLFNWRALTLVGTAALLAGCQIVPKTGPVVTAPVDEPVAEPSATVLPTDETRHRIALLVPLTGRNADVGQSLSNATTMALLDTNASNLRITTYDTSSGAREAADKAIADGNRLILGPLLAENVTAVVGRARGAGVPVVSFSNDAQAAQSGAFVMGQIPEQSIARSVSYARRQGATNFASLAPNGDYGDRSISALNNALRDFGGSLVTSERYARGNTAIISAARRLRARGGYDTVLIADGASLSTQGAVALTEGSGDVAEASTRIVGTELWSGESSLTRPSAMRGAIFSAVSDARFKRFSDTYEERFGSKPYRVSTLGYDAVLLTLRVARDWRIGSRFPIAQLRDTGGFLGLDGPFRFGRDGVVERSMEVRQITNGQIRIVDQAPARFND
jgi:ABC-type branched-subunit amino acid transport system substrate-binding protein